MNSLFALSVCTDKIKMKNKMKTIKQNDFCADNKLNKNRISGRALKHSFANGLKSDHFRCSLKIMYTNSTLFFMMSLWFCLMVWKLLSTHHSCEVKI